MKTISIRQPWARCIAVGRKTVENRGRSTSYRGLLAIHAGGTPDLGGDMDPRVLYLFGADPRVNAPVGAVIAVATLTDCHRAKVFGPINGSLRTCCEPWGEPYHCNPRGVAVEAWHLILADIYALPKPVYCPGKVMVPFALPDPAAERVLAQLAGAVTSGA